jgi:hypothetical protein
LKTSKELLEYAEKNPEKMGKIDQALEYMTKRDGKDPAVLAAAQANKIKIIDMTGKEQRVMHGYESFGQMSRMGRLQATGDGTTPKKFDLPELMYNLDLLVNMTENKIIQTDKKLKSYDDMIVSNAYEEKRGIELAKKQQEHIDRMKSLVACIDQYALFALLALLVFYSIKP